MCKPKVATEWPAAHNRSRGVGNGCAAQQWWSGQAMETATVAVVGGIPRGPLPYRTRGEEQQSEQGNRLRVTTRCRPHVKRLRLPASHLGRTDKLDNALRSAEPAGQGAPQGLSSQQTFFPIVLKAAVAPFALPSITRPSPWTSTRRVNAAAAGMPMLNPQQRRGGAVPVPRGPDCARDAPR